MPRTVIASLSLFVAAAAVADDPPAGDAAETLRGLGGIVMPISQADDRMEVALHLASGTVDDAVIDAVVKVPNLAWLNLAGTKVTDAGVAKLAGAETLERLHLERTEVTDASAAALAKLPKLTYLNLYGTKLTDAGLAELRKSPSLRKLFVWQTAVTQAAVEAANAADSPLTVVGEVTLPPVEEKPKPDAEKGDKKPAEDKPKPAEEKAGGKPTPAADKPQADKPQADKPADTPKADKPDGNE